MVDSVIESWRGASDRERLLKVIQPGLIGLIDGTLSTLAPIFAAAYLAGSRAALLVGLAAALGAAISMGLSEALSDDGSLTGRGTSAYRGLITGVATFVGGTAQALPFLIDDLGTALPIAYTVVAARAGRDRLGPQAIPSGGAQHLADSGDAGGRDRGHASASWSARLSGPSTTAVRRGCPATIFGRPWGRLLCPRARFMGPVGLLRKVIGYDPAKGR